MHFDGCPCFQCIVRNTFEHKKRKPSFPVQAYGLFTDVVTLSFRDKILRARGQRLPAVLRCKDILDATPRIGHALMGDLAPLVFDLLGLRHSRDLHRIAEEGISVNLFPQHQDGERFADYDVDLIKAMRKMVPAGSPP